MAFGNTVSKMDTDDHNFSTEDPGIIQLLKQQKYVNKMLWVKVLIFQLISWVLLIIFTASSQIEYIVHHRQFGEVVIVDSFYP